MGKMLSNHQPINLQGRAPIAKLKSASQSLLPNPLKPGIDSDQLLLSLFHEAPSANSLCMKIESIEVLML